MARNESDREDLMKEATALIRRIEFCVADNPQQIVAGFRKTGGLSLYFEADPVYHVDEMMRLRRAYVDGYLYRTQGTTLAQLNRQRTKTTTTLHRYDLGEEECQAFCKQVATNIQNLFNSLQKNDVQIHQQIPEDVPLLDELKEALQKILEEGIQLAPAIAAKK
ncbi:hypothetical protein MNBD_PLANCTO02-856 [hydrothermal vent metagenome]|uniref:Uncharacterized protein n=1 Tax=hydrothermal vent metagenome TaxID=652676 RepID=A0A3B1E774_9ZZZZ